jgi:hypothetical protein
MVVLAARPAPFEVHYVLQVRDRIVSRRVDSNLPWG